MDKKKYSKPEIEEIRLQRLMDDSATLPRASQGEDHDVDAKPYDIWGPDEAEPLPDNKDNKLWEGWD